MATGQGASQTWRTEHRSRPAPASQTVRVLRHRSRQLPGGDLSCVAARWRAVPVRSEVFGW